jgi:putative membrane protein
MTIRTYRWLQAGVLLGLGLYLLHKIFSGTLYYYINQRFLWLVALGGAAFLLIGIMALPKREHAHGDAHHEHDHEHSSPSRLNLLVLAIPLLLGFLVPSRPLDSSALESRGLTTNALLGAGGQQAAVELERPSDERTVLDWVRAFNYAIDPAIYAGEQADLIGFVYHDERLGENQFLVGRFAVSCCVADAFAIGVIVESEDAQEWPSNSWVHVSGSMQVGSLGGEVSPLIVAESIKEVPVPPQPYLFP